MPRSGARVPRAVVAATTALLLGVGALVAPTPAFAERATMSGVGTSDAGALIVYLVAPDALWVRATVHDARGTTLLATDDLTGNSSNWTTTAPVRLPADVPYGDYPVDVDYRLADGHTEHWSGEQHPAQATFRYAARSRIATAAFDRDHTDYDHRTATVRGTAVRYDPATDATGPARAGITVSVGYDVASDDGWTPRTVTGTTAADGTFAVAVVPGAAITLATVRLLGPDTADDVTSRTTTDLASVEARSIHVRMLGGPGHVRVHAGRTYPVSGIAQRLTDTSGWQPLVGARIATYRVDQYGTRQGMLGSGSTDRSGRFAYRPTARTSTGFVTQPPPSPYVELDTGPSGRLDVPTAGRYTSLTLAQDQYRTVTARGRLRGNCAGQRVVVQYSSSGRSGWRAIGSARAGGSSRGSCGFQAKGVGGVAGYYRVTHTESDAMLALTSARKRLARTSTRITSFSTSPTRPTRNGKLTATGSLSQLVGGRWRGLRGKVGLIWRPKGDSTFYLMGRATAAASGRFTVSGKAYGDGVWAVIYYADAHHFYSETAVRSVDVR